MKQHRTVLPALAIVALASPLTAADISGSVHAAGMRDNADAVVYIDAIPDREFPAPTEHAVVDQKDMEFVPHVLPVVVGTTVDFKNDDALLHNVFTPDKCAERFNLGTWPMGEHKSYTFKQPCAATLLCNVHPEMEGYVVALPTPYFAVTDKSGAYTIKDVPDGTYTVRVWHPNLKEGRQQVVVSGHAEADFELKK